MPWIKLDVNFLENPKIDALSDGAKLLHLWALCYAGRQLTDGFVPLKQVAEKTHLVTELVTALLWHEVINGYEIHDYLKHQSSRGQVKGAQETTRKRVARHRETGDVTPLLTLDVLAVEVEVEVEQKIKDIDQSKIDRESAFKTFWLMFPRKVGKFAAEKSFEKALKLATSQEIFDGVIRYSRTCGTDPKFIAHPATWLNQGRWLDITDGSGIKVAKNQSSRDFMGIETLVPPDFDPNEFRNPDKASPESIRKIRALGK